MNKIIQVEAVTTYQTRIYVRSEDHKWIGQLTKKETINESDMISLKTAGYSFEWVTQDDVELARIKQLVS